MSSTKFQAKSLRELYDIVNKPSKVYKDKTSALSSATVKTDTSVIIVKDPSTGEDTSIVKASVYSFNGVETKKGLGNILSAGDIDLTINTCSAYNILSGYCSINTYKGLIDNPMAYTDVSAPRRAGQVILNSNFELKYAAPLDARTVADTPDKLYDPDWWLADSGGYVYLYRGMSVSIKSTGDLYTYMGPDIEIKSNNVTIANALGPSNWKIISSPATIKRAGLISIANNYQTPAYTDTSALLINAYQDSSAPGIAIGENTILLGNHYNRTKSMSEIVLIGNTYDDYQGLIITRENKNNLVALQNINGQLKLISGNLDSSSGRSKEYSHIQVNPTDINITSDNNGQFSEINIAPGHITFQSDMERFGYDWCLAIDNKKRNVIFRGLTDEEGEDSDNYEQFNHVLMTPFEYTVNMSNHVGGGSINLITNTLRLWDQNTKFVKPTANGQVPVYKVDSSTGVGSIIWEQGDILQTTNNSYNTPKFIKFTSNIVQGRCNKLNQFNTYVFDTTANPSFILTAETSLYTLQAEINVVYHINESEPDEGWDAAFGSNRQNGFEIKPDISMKILDYNISHPEMLKFIDSDPTISIPIGLAYNIVSGSLNKNTLRYKLSFYLYTPENDTVTYSIKQQRGSWSNDNTDITTPGIIDASSGNASSGSGIDTPIGGGDIIKPGIDTPIGGGTLKPASTSWKYSYDAAVDAGHIDTSKLGDVYNMCYVPIIGLKFDQDMSGDASTFKPTNNSTNWADIIKQIVTHTDISSGVTRYGITPDDLSEFTDLHKLINNQRVDVISVLFYIIADLQRQITALKES